MVHPPLRSAGGNGSDPCALAERQVGRAEQGRLVEAARGEGGSHDGDCELSDKECIWARAYERLKHFRESKDLLKGPAVFYNAELRGTSSWANTFLGRDHHAAAEKSGAADASSAAPASERKPSVTRTSSQAKTEKN